ncbi:hypothetical protein MWH28_08405 [Natroniella sulfidigena]|uniref:arsenic resistance protein n=1 Tax=Natroniella sulfidigena TaxID=723921 RepID=UPI00200B1F73|nr:hypothetical protein [Natroniella sulfidigena]MCK8817377.1 hypothetical protein [Natroniella sulfidigena]
MSNKDNNTGKLNQFERSQFFFITLAVFTGLYLSRFELITVHAADFILPFLMLMLYGVFLQVSVKNLGQAFTNIKFTGLGVGINFIWNPLLAFGLAILFLSDLPDIQIGFIMLMVTPCTDWYLLFTALARGNIALGVSILPWKLLLQLLLLPIYLFVLVGQLIEIDPTIIGEGVIFVLVIPFVAAFITNKVILSITNSNLEWLENKVYPKIEIFEFLFLCLAITAMFSSQGKVLFDQPSLFFRMLVPVLLFYSVNLILGNIISYLIGFSYQDNVALNFAILARNSPLALAIAVSIFPDRPLIPLALAIGPLIELPMLALISKFFLVINKYNLFNHG